MYYCRLRVDQLQV